MNAVYCNARITGTWFVYVTAIIHASFADAGSVTIDTVAVGNIGNMADDTGFGAVAYRYRIAATEITNTQYAAFLNAKAASDLLGLFSTDMDGFFGGIVRSGTSGSYTYNTISGRENWPVNHVNWYDALRFANWLHNGQGDGDTESGAYTLLGGTPIPTNGSEITRNGDARWWLTSEDEWYKAAYHKNDGNTANYFDYPTSSDVYPATVPPPGGINSANHGPAVGILTEVGAYANSPSPYRTYDQGGNVWEWNESWINESRRGARGGSFHINANNLASYKPSSADPTLEAPNLGFRVAMVPEPGGLALAWIALVGFFLFGFPAVRRKLS